MKIKIIGISFLIIFFFTAVFATAQESIQPSSGAVAGDLLMRPFTAAGSIVTTSVCMVTMPLAFIMGVGEQWARIAIEAPWRFTVARPLGEFDKYYDGNPITVLHR